MTTPTKRIESLIYDIDFYNRHQVKMAQQEEDTVKYLTDSIPAVIRLHPDLAPSAAYELGRAIEHVERYELDSAREHLQAAIDSLDIVP